MTVTVADAVAPNNALFGFGCEALLASNANAGTLAITDAVLTKLVTPSSGAGSGRTNVVHTGTNNVGPNTQPFSFHWTAPASGSGVVTFYAAGNAADGDGGTAGDYIYTTTLVVAQNTVGINESAASNFNLSVFPNPTSDYLNVKFTLNEASSVSMNLIDITGNKVANLISDNGIKGEINRIFDISTYSKGVYIVELKINDKTSFQKIVVE